MPTVWDHVLVRWAGVAGAAGAGLVLGVLARDMPLALALAVIPSPEIDDCGMEEALGCAMEKLPTALGKAIELALLVLFLCAVLAALGAVSLGLGAHRLLRARPITGEGGERARGAARAVGPILIGTGTCLLVPGLWLVGSLLVFLAR